MSTNGKGSLSDERRAAIERQIRLQREKDQQRVAQEVSDRFYRIWSGEESHE